MGYNTNASIKFNDFHSLGFLLIRLIETVRQRIRNITFYFFSENINIGIVVQALFNGNMFNMATLPVIQKVATNLFFFQLNGVLFLLFGFHLLFQEDSQELYLFLDNSFILKIIGLAPRCFELSAEAILTLTTQLKEPSSFTDAEFSVHVCVKKTRYFSLRRK